MGARSRINRPTNATPAKAAPPRFVHVSTDYRHVPVDFRNPSGPTRFVRVRPGTTYRRPD